MPHLFYWSLLILCDRGDLSVKVLILEDDDLVAQGLVRCLGYLGHEAVHLRRVEQARASVRGASDFDVALIDIGLEDRKSVV